MLALVGYGTKMGLAPLHTWKPDAYGESPGVIGALLAGGVTSCAFLALLRFYAIVAAAGELAFARELMVGMGLLSMLWAAVFMVRQLDIRRLLAYSSVEHMGILAFGIGIGGARRALRPVPPGRQRPGQGRAVHGGRQHQPQLRQQATALRHAARSGARRSRAGCSSWASWPSPAPRRSRRSSASSTSPPRPSTPPYLWTGVAFLVLLGGIFLAMSDTVVQVVFGTPPPDRARTPYRDTWATTAPLVAALALSVTLGLWLPGPLTGMIRSAANLVEGGNELPVRPRPQRPRPAPDGAARPHPGRIPRHASSRACAPASAWPACAPTAR